MQIHGYGKNLLRAENKMVQIKIEKIQKSKLTVILQIKWREKDNKNNRA